MLLSILNFFFMFSYITNSSSFPKPLSVEEEEKYINLLSEGCEEAKNILIERNLRLVAHIVKKYSNYSRDAEDLISIGTIGLVKAIITFKAGKGTRLATYAARCIENEILMSIRSGKKYQNDVSLQDTVGIDKDGNEVTLQDKVADDSCCIDEQVEQSLIIGKMYGRMKNVLSGRELEIIELRYGIKTGEEVTQREIAKKMGISRSYVSRIEKRALAKLNKALEEYR